MTSVGAYEAKTHLSQLLDRAERGERITINRDYCHDHGQYVAQAVRICARRPAALSGYSITISA
jgi:antitoxin (DNA-binding transcriptional repressor) of toxin-antitoxin stability system